MSEKSVADKLLIKAGTAVWSSHTEHRRLVEPLPTQARFVDQVEQATTVLLFADSASSLQQLLVAHADHLKRPEILWVAYPKGGRSDINRDSLWPMLTEYGLRPITQISLDEVWSALRFRPLREGEPPFTGGR
jgi:hypothetical protein